MKTELFRSHFISRLTDRSIPQAQVQGRLALRTMFRAIVRTGFVILFLLVVTPAIIALKPVVPAADQPGTAPRYIPRVLSFSGSPPLLQITLEDLTGADPSVDEPGPEASGGAYSAPDSANPRDASDNASGARLIQVELRSEGSYQSYRIPEDLDEGSLEIRSSPFLVPGVHDLTIDVRAELGGEEHVTRAPVRIGFVDFVFGRDNFRFGNNDKYESRIGSYGEILAAWLEERFDAVTDAELVILADYMYGLFGKNTGRCYGFSGSELRYWLWPDLLPSYYDSTYDIRGRVRRYQREMHYLQLDIVYDYLSAGRDVEVRQVDPGQVDPSQDTLTAGYIGFPGGTGAASRESTLREVDRITDRIASGRPAAVGFIGPDLHHSMLVYGFIHNPLAETINLLVANNWKSGEKTNIRSLDAEIVQVHLGNDPDEPLLTWRNSDEVRDRAIDRLFVVDVQKEYQHSRDSLDGIVRARLEQLRADDRSLLVIENASEAWLTREEEAGETEKAGETEITGYTGRRTREEIDGVVFERVNRNYRFEYPAGGELWLEMTDDKGARLLHLMPGKSSGTETAWIETTSVTGEEAPVERRLRLGTLEASWEIIAEADD